jgi:hypothetical protein
MTIGEGACREHLVAERRLPYCRPMTPDRLKFLAILAAILAVFLCYEFLVQFHDWNRLQTCASAGLRNCR